MTQRLPRTPTGKSYKGHDTKGSSVSLPQKVKSQTEFAWPDCSNRSSPRI